MSSSAFTNRLRSLGNKQVEHVAYRGLYEADPSFLVILEKDGQEAAVYGGFLITPAELADAVMNRAQELMLCSCVSDRLERCRARFLTADSESWWEYDAERLTYVQVKYES